MKKRTNESRREPRLVDLSGLADYLNTGLRTAQRIGRQAGAVRKINGSVRYDLRCIDLWLDGLIDGPDDDENF